MNPDKPLLRELCRIAQEAGKAIMAVYQARIEAWEKADRSPLTEADLCSDRIIRQELEAAFPEIFILSEESTSQSTTQSDQSFFLVDPLDGTKEFLKRNGEFTVNIALIQQGYPVAGVVYAPAKQTLYYAAADQGAWKQQGQEAGERLSVNSTNLEGSLRVIGSRSHDSEALKQWVLRLPSHTFVPAGSSLKFCLVADNQADIYPRFGTTMQWDTAAGQCILEQAGGRVIDTEGKRLAYGLNRPHQNSHFFALAAPSLIEWASL